VSASTSLLSLPNVLINSLLNRSILMRLSEPSVFSAFRFSALNWASDRVTSAWAAASISALRGCQLFPQRLDPKRAVRAWLVETGVIVIISSLVEPKLQIEPGTDPLASVDGARLQCINDLATRRRHHGGSHAAQYLGAEPRHSIV